MLNRTFLLSKTDCKYSHTNCNIFVMTTITQDDHLLSAGAWAACGLIAWFIVKHLRWNGYMFFSFRGIGSYNISTFRAQMV